jgi:hypothetical protein
MRPSLLLLLLQSAVFWLLFITCAAVNLFAGA